MVPNLTLINNGTIVKDGKTYPVLEVLVEPGDDSDPDKLTFVWNATDQTNTTLTLRLYFDQARWVSSNSNPDKFKLIFRDPLIFTGQNGLQIEKEHYVLERDLPPQLGADDSEAQAVIGEAVEGAKNALRVNFVLTLVLSAGLNQLLQMIHTQQLVVLMPLFKVIIPANASLFFAQMMAIAAFDLIETGPYLDVLLNLPPSDPLNSNFAAVGFESRFVLHNMGTLLLALVIYLVSAIFAFIMRKMCCDIVVHKGQLWHEQLFNSTLINIVTESYSIFSVSCLINVKNLEWSSTGLIVMSTTAIILLLLILTYPLVYGIFMVRNLE